MSRRADSLWVAVVKSKTRSVPPRDIANDPSTEAGLSVTQRTRSTVPDTPWEKTMSFHRELRSVALGTFSFSEHCEAEGWGGFLSQSCLESSEKLGSWVKFLHLEIRNLNLRVKRKVQGWEFGRRLSHDGKAWPSALPRGPDGTSAGTGLRAKGPQGSAPAPPSMGAQGRPVEVARCQASHRPIPPTYNALLPSAWMLALWTHFICFNKASFLFSEVFKIGNSPFGFLLTPSLSPVAPAPRWLQDWENLF